MNKREVKRLHKLGIFEGIIAATSVAIASLVPDESGDIDEDDVPKIEAADQWARRMRTVATDGRE